MQRSQMEFERSFSEITFGSNKAQVYFTDQLGVREYSHENQPPLTSSMMNYYAYTDTKSVSQSSGETSEFLPNEKINSVYYDIVRDIAGLWGSHRFYRSPFNDHQRPYKNFEAITALDENEKGGKLSKKMIGASLSYLEKCPIFQLYALCRCVLYEKDLTDISALRTYHFIQYLDLSYNELTTLEPLGQMPFLQYLDVSHNALENLLDFAPPLYLTHVNYCNNLISEIPDLSDFWSIVHLDLSYNKICKIKGLENLKYLCHLILAENGIEKIENINNLRIQTLNLSSNCIKDIEEEEEEEKNKGFKTLIYLRYIDLSNNEIKSLQYLKDNSLLITVKMSNNFIQNLLELYYLQDKRFLTHLDLSRNPISIMPFYKEVCIRSIPNLHIFDSEIVTEEQRIEYTVNSNTNFHLASRENRLLLLFLEQVNRPKIGYYMVPYDEPPPNLIILVGPPASRKKILVNNFVNSFERLVQGVSYTTRPKAPGEEDGKEYYFISEEEFQQKLEQGQFMTMSEFNGHSYAISDKEFEKGLDDKVIVFYSDLMTAFSLKLIGIRPKLVLAIPRSEEIHLQWLKEAYHCKPIEPNCLQICYGINMDQSIINDYEIITSLVDGSVKAYMGTSNDVYLCKSDNIPTQKAESENLRSFNKSGILKKSFNADEMSLTGIQNSGELYLFWRNKLEQKSVSWLHGTDGTDTQSNNGNINSNEFPKQSTRLQAEQPDSKIKPKNSPQTKTPDTQQEPNEYMKSFHESVFKTRNDLLQMHWENPGLFRDIIFTEEIDESLSKLKILLKDAIRNNTIPVDCDFTEDKYFSEMLHKKIRKIDFQKFKYIDN